jgi:hypothetical protein
VNFAAITLCAASQQVFVVVVVTCLFNYDSVRKLLDTPLYVRERECVYACMHVCVCVCVWFRLVRGTKI